MFECLKILLLRVCGLPILRSLKVLLLRARRHLHDSMDGWQLSTCRTGARNVRCHVSWTDLQIGPSTPTSVQEWLYQNDTEMRSVLLPSTIFSCSLYVDPHNLYQEDDKWMKTGEELRQRDRFCAIILLANQGNIMYHLTVPCCQRVVWTWFYLRAMHLCQNKG